MPLSCAKWAGPPAGVYACLITRTCAGASLIRVGGDIQKLPGKADHLIIKLGDVQRAMLQDDAQYAVPMEYDFTAMAILAREAVIETVLAAQDAVFAPGAVKAEFDEQQGFVAQLQIAFLAIGASSGDCDAFLFTAAPPVHQQ